MNKLLGEGYKKQRHILLLEDGDFSPVQESWNNKGIYFYWKLVIFVLSSKTGAGFYKQLCLSACLWMCLGYKKQGHLHPERSVFSIVQENWSEIL